MSFNIWHKEPTTTIIALMLSNYGSIKMNVTPKKYISKQLFCRSTENLKVRSNTAQSRTSRKKMSTKPFALGKEKNPESKNSNNKTGTQSFRSGVSELTGETQSTGGLTLQGNTDYTRERRRRRRGGRRE